MKVKSFIKFLLDHFNEDDNLYECDELDNDVVDIIDELIK